MLNALGMVQPEQMEQIIAHLEKRKSNLESDVSNYAKGRLRYWLQHEWSLKEKTFIPGCKDERLWNWCKHWMPDADLGLVVYGSVGIKPHRDDSYADWRGVGINLGEIESWYYDCQYPEFRYTKIRNESNPIHYNVPPGTVFEFNTKNPHGAINPDPNRWAIFLWKVSKKFRENFNNSTEQSRIQLPLFSGQM